MKMLLKIIAIVFCCIVVLIIVLVGLFMYQSYKMQKVGGKIVEWSDGDGTVYRNLRYGEGNRNCYDLFIPANVTADALMLFIHGGGWIGGEKEDLEYEARRYAKMGYITATINYTRIATDSIDYSSQYNAACFPTMMNEIYASVSAIKSKCEELGYDLTQMAIGGYSAGGHLAMLYAARYATTSPLPVKFQMSWVGPSDFNLLFPTDEKSLEQIAKGGQSDALVQSIQDLKNLFYNATGEIPTIEQLTKERLEEIKRSVSPADLVSDDTPPAILAYGGKDMLIRSLHGKRMADALQKGSVDCMLVVFPNSGHELGQDKECTQAIIDAVTLYCNKYFD